MERNGFLETLFNQNGSHFHVKNLTLSKSTSLKQKIQQFHIQVREIQQQKAYGFKKKLEDHIKGQPSNIQWGMANKIKSTVFRKIHYLSTPNNSLVHNPIIKHLRSRQSRLATLQEPQLINIIFLPANVDLTTCKVLSHNVLEKNDYLCAILFWGGLGLKTWRFVASISKQKHQI